MDSPNYAKVGEWCKGVELHNQLYPGDLVEMDRGEGKRKFFKHWAVCLQNEDGKAIIIHVNTDVGVALGAAVGKRDTIADVCVALLEDVVGSSPCRVNNIIDARFEPYAKGEIVAKRGLSKLGEHDYSPWSSNCEHFSSWCRNGRMESTQADQAAKYLEEIKSTPENIKLKEENQLEKIKHKMDEMKVIDKMGPPPPPSSMCNIG